MVIDGKQLAEKVFDEIKKDLSNLRAKGINPKLVIVTVGENKAWQTYVNIKTKKAIELGIDIEHINVEENQDKLLEIINRLNKDKSVHGFIVQRPVPNSIDRLTIVDAINKEKDIDGFKNDTKFQSTVWLAIETVLKEIYKLKNINQTFEGWLLAKNIAIIGKGETGGGPTIKELQKMGVKPRIIDSKTKNREKIINNADIIICAAGKDRVVEAKFLKKGVILIGVGMHKDDNGKIHGDYEEEDIKNIVSYYTPTPGGIGPLNLSFLFKNLIIAIKQT